MGRRQPTGARMDLSQRQCEMRRMDDGIRVCVRCPLHASRTHAVPGEGPVDAPVFVIGEAPGAREDRLGRPFVGASGVLLNTLLGEASIEREALYITSCVKCRPPQNRTPHTGELAACRVNWLAPQLATVNPRIVLLLGAVALRTAAGRTERLTDIHGEPFEQDGRVWVATFHPAAGLRADDRRQDLRRDLDVLRGLL